MPSYKLTYFSLTGLGEPIRFLLSYGGANFEDVRINLEDWPKHKPNMPMGQMPILEIDGKPYHQSKAISRYLAKKFNLYGSDDLQALEIDAAVDDIDDMRLVIVPLFREKEAAGRAKLMATVDEKVPFILGKLEERAKANGGYLIGKKLTWPDIYLTALTDMCSHLMGRELLKGYPTLSKLYETVRANPKIKAYLEKRPKTAF